MKVTIKSGESVENALKYLQEFLEKIKEEYPLLTRNMNVYFNLKGFGELICPENEKEYLLTKSDEIDVDVQLRKDARENLLAFWTDYLRRNTHVRSYSFLQRNIDTDRRYIDTAEAKGRRPDLVKKRQKSSQAISKKWKR